MTHKSAVEALAAATGSLSAQHDVHDAIAHILSDCRVVLPLPAWG